MKVYNIFLKTISLVARETRKKGRLPFFSMPGDQQWSRRSRRVAPRDSFFDARPGDVGPLVQPLSGERRCGILAEPAVDGSLLVDVPVCQKYRLCRSAHGDGAHDFFEAGHLRFPGLLPSLTPPSKPLLDRDGAILSAQGLLPPSSPEELLQGKPLFGGLEAVEAAPGQVPDGVLASVRCHGGSNQVLYSKEKGFSRSCRSWRLQRWKGERAFKVKIKSHLHPRRSGVPRLGLLSTTWRPDILTPPPGLSARVVRPS